MMTTGEAWALLFDRLDKLDRTIGGIDDRLRCVEQSCEGIRHDLDNQRSRVSRETKAQGEADQSLEARIEVLEGDLVKRVQSLETAAVATVSERRGFSKAAAILALVAAGGTGAGVESLIKVLAGG